MPEMSLDEIKKLTVADLKKELKARNLPVGGNKSDLTQRLLDFFVSSEERQLLEHSGVDESLLEGVHEDEVLGISSGEFAGIDDITLTLPETVQPAEVEKGKTIPKPTTTVGGSTSASVTAKPTVATQPPAKEQKQPFEATKSPVNPVSADSDTTATRRSADPGQQKIDRTKRFNIPLSEGDRKTLRAERFSTGATSKASTHTGTGLDADALAKRAQRFGMPVVKTSKDSATATATTTGENAEKLKQRAERFGVTNKVSQQSNGSTSGVKSGAESEKLLKRQMRFGGGGGGGFDAAAKKARAERFGLSNQ